MRRTLAVIVGAVAIGEAFHHGYDLAFNSDGFTGAVRSRETVATAVMAVFGMGLLWYGVRT